METKRFIPVDRGICWSVVEVLPPSAPEPTLKVVTWLTQGQAEALADACNDICGYEWQKRYPEWAEKRRQDA